MSAPLPKQPKSGHGNASMDVEPTILVEPTADDADSLISSNDPDDMANEQTWPTEEEMRGNHGTSEFDDAPIPDAHNGTTPKVVKKIPKGMSEYQAAWIIDESDDEDEGENDQVKGSDEVEMEETEEEEMVDFDDEADGKKTVDFEDLDMEEEDRQ